MSSPIRPESMKPSNDIGNVVDVLAGEAEEQGSLGDLFGDRETSACNEDIDEEEFAPKIVAKDPGSPTQAEIDEHNVDHFPYRAWCECCVAGRGTGEQHVPGVESRIPILAFDYCFLTQGRVYTRQELTDEQLKKPMVKILVLKDTKSRAVFAHVVRRKGVQADEYAVKRIAEDVAWLGYTKVILKCDGESSITKLLRESLKRIKTSVVDQASFEHPPTYDSKSNGSVENAVKQIKGMLRTLKLGLERNIGKRVPDEYQSCPGSLSTQAGCSPSDLVA